ncbi:hypothetical protein ACFLYC_00115 [Chloroflexota bacterium]
MAIRVYSKVLAYFLPTEYNSGVDTIFLELPLAIDGANSSQDRVGLYMSGKVTGPICYAKEISCVLNRKM